MLMFPVGEKLTGLIALALAGATSAAMASAARISPALADPNNGLLAGAERELLHGGEAAIGRVDRLDLELALLGQLRAAELGELHLDLDLARATMLAGRLDELRLL